MITLSAYHQPRDAVAVAEVAEVAEAVDAFEGQSEVER